MQRKTFWLLFCGLQIFYVTAKIYQHHVTIGAQYKKEELLAQIAKQKRLNEELSVQLCSLKNPTVATRLAKSKLGMKDLALSDIVRLQL